MKMLVIVTLLTLIAAPVVATASQVQGRNCRPSYQSGGTAKKQAYQPRSRAGAYAKPSYLQGNHKALGKH